MGGRGARLGRVPRRATRTGTEAGDADGYEAGDAASASAGRDRLDALRRSAARPVPVTPALGTLGFLCTLGTLGMPVTLGHLCTLVTLGMPVTLGFLCTLVTLGMPVTLGLPGTFWSVCTPVTLGVPAGLRSAPSLHRATG